MVKWTLNAVAFPVLVLVCVIGAPIAWAQDAGPQGWQPFGSITPAYIAPADIDGGGEYESRFLAVSVGTTGPIGPSTRAGLTLAYSYTDNRFEASTAFGPIAPWGDMERIGLSASVIRMGGKGWLFVVSPSADYFREENADFGDALTYGAVVVAAKSFREGRMLGLGVGAFSQLEDVRMFAFPVVDWALTERLRINNPLQAGPTGSAGLEINYRVSKAWALGVGGAYREAAYRLRDDGPYPGGVGQEAGVIAFLHAGTQPGQRLEIDLYGGAIINGTLEVQDDNGDSLVERDFGTAPIIGATLKLSF
jgi:hypothetical protein